MMIKIFIYSSVLGAILFLPERIWESLWQKALRFFHVLKEMEAKNPVQKEGLQGKKLLALFPEIEAKLSLGLKTTSMDLPQYKFYTGLIVELLQVHRKLGISLKSILPELRQNLIKDLQFEGRMKSSVLGGNLQFLVITLTTWGFIFLSSSLAELPLKLFDLTVILAVQIIAIIIFNAVLIKMKHFIFSKFNHTIESLYLFISLVEIGLPVSKVLADSRVLESGLMTHKKFASSADRITTLVKRWKDNGISPKIETAEVIAEIWHMKSTTFETFIKQQELLKFVILAFFFLPAYFYYLYSIFKYFLES